jgi:hypothetical protein
MPTVKVGKVVKKFPYTKEGKQDAAAEKKKAKKMSKYVMGK